MDKAVESVCEALQGLHTTLSTTDGSEEETALGANLQNFPFISPKDIVEWPATLETALRESGHQDLDEKSRVTLQHIADRIKERGESDVAIFQGQYDACISYLMLLIWVEHSLGALFGWRFWGKPGTMPVALIRKANSQKTKLEKVDDDIAEFDAKRTLINETCEAASSLQSLAQQAKSDYEHITSLETESRYHSQEIIEMRAISSTHHKDIIEYSQQAEELKKQCDTAFRSVTATGLAGAFDQRAKGLLRKQSYWVLGLIGALASGVWLGVTRFDNIQAVLQIQNPNTFAFVTYMLSAFLSLGASIWFAWIATKQIGQNFRLAEDYSFKAAIATAYESYKREAVDINPMLQERLFAATMDRLEEAPLRFVSAEQPATPIQELLEMDEFQQALNKVPSLGGKVAGFFPNIWARVMGRVSPAQSGSPKNGKPPDPDSDQE